MTSNGGDFYGQLLTPEDPGTQLDPDVPTDLFNPVATIPEPSSLMLGLLAMMGWLGCRQR